MSSNVIADDTNISTSTKPMQEKSIAEIPANQTEQDTPSVEQLTNEVEKTKNLEAPEAAVTRESITADAEQVMTRAQERIMLFDIKSEDPKTQADIAASTKQSLETLQTSREEFEGSLGLPHKTQSDSSEPEKNLSDRIPEFEAALKKSTRRKTKIR